LILHGADPDQVATTSSPCKAIPAPIPVEIPHRNPLIPRNTPFRPPLKPLTLAFLPPVGNKLSPPRTIPILHPP
jgi:hypothetical protein